MYRLDKDGKSIDFDPAVFDTRGYHRLNIWGMGDARGELVKIGIVRDGPFPDPPSDENEDVETWRCRAALGDGPGIPIHKLCTNDGWIITPIEVKSGVMWADLHHPGWRDDLSEHVREFVEWMEASLTGFEVW
jgi:hypothetical protein